MMSTSPQHSNGTVANASVAAARPILLVRYRPGLTSATARVVHLMPLPSGGHPGTTSALCGALLRAEDIETVTPGQGVPCDRCMVSHATTGTDHDTAHGDRTTTPDLAGVGAKEVSLVYQRWGWPVVLSGNQLWLDLAGDVVALLVRIPLADQVEAILVARRCPVPVVAHPYLPEHRVLLAGERYGVALPWPPPAHLITGNLLLPPSRTARGPVTWMRPPQPDALTLCREIDMFSALRTALHEPPDAPTHF